MFDSLQDAINFANDEKKRSNDGGVPRFYKNAVAKRNGEKVDWVDEIWVQIFNKGDPKNIMERPMREEDKKRWPEFWKAYLEDAEPDIDGIPLAEFPQITPAEREKCKSLHLRSVEDLANYPDAQIQDLGGRGHALQKAAREYIDYRKGESITDLKDEIAQLRKELAELKDKDSGADSNSDTRQRSEGDKPSSEGDVHQWGSGVI